MDNEAMAKELRDQRALLEQIYISAEKTRKYYLWTMIVTAVFFILPLIVMVFAIPYFISSYGSLFDGTSLGL